MSFEYCLRSSATRAALASLASPPCGRPEKYETTEIAATGAAEITPTGADQRPAHMRRATAGQARSADTAVRGK